VTQRGAWTPQKVRDRIKVGVLIQRLTDHMLGKLELSQTQLKAAEILLKKSLPDLQAIDATVKGDANHPIVVTQTDTTL
jgi:hypothetical protein